MKNAVKITVLTVALAMVAACGGSSSSSGTPSFTSVSSLPKATSPMETTAATSISKQMNLFTTGVDHVVPTFTSANSRGACETYNQVKQGVTSAGQADMIMCYVQYMDTNNKFNIDPATGEAIDIYDGEYHIFNLDITGADDGAPEKVKMKITKNAAGSIDYFEMFMCNLTGSTLAQTVYTKQVIDGPTMTMRAIGYNSDTNWTGWHSVDVTGTLNTSGQYTAKTIVVKNVGGNTDDTNRNWQDGTLIQQPGSFNFSGYQNGNWAQGDNTGSYQNAAYSVGQMLNDTSASPKDLAVGIGAVQFSSANTMGGETYTDTGTDAWDIDYVQEATNAYLDTASDGTLVTPQAEFTMAFAEIETWDCSGTGVDMDPVDEATVAASCADVVFAGGDTWVNCYENTNPDFSGTYATTGSTCPGLPSTVTLTGNYPVYAGTGDLEQISFGDGGNCSSTVTGETSTCTYTGTGDTGSVVTLTITDGDCTIVMTK